MDVELQKEISVIWPHLSQKSLDFLVPINKGERSCRAGFCILKAWTPSYIFLSV